MKFARAPWRLFYLGSVDKRLIFVEPFVNGVNIAHYKPVRRPVVRTFPFLRVVPLQVKLDIVDKTENRAAALVVEILIGFADDPGSR